MTKMPGGKEKVNKLITAVFNFGLLREINLLYTVHTLHRTTPSRVSSSIKN